MTDSECNMLASKYELLIKKFKKNALKYSLVSYDERFKSLCNSERFNALDDSSTVFPECVMNVDELLKLVDALRMFPFTFYVRRNDIVLFKGNGEDKYDQLKAYDCLCSPMRIDGEWFIPFKLIMRLKYLPNAGKVLKITYSGNGWDRVIMSMDESDVLSNRCMKRKVVERIKFIPIDIMIHECRKNGCDDIHDICSVHDPTYVKAWCKMIHYNLTHELR